MTKIIIARLVDDKTFGVYTNYKLVPKVLHSTHPKYKIGSRFDFGYASVALEEGYIVTILPEED